MKVSDLKFILSKYQKALEANHSIRVTGPSSLAINTYLLIYAAKSDDQLLPPEVVNDFLKPNFAGHADLFYIVFSYYYLSINIESKQPVSEDKNLTALFSLKTNKLRRIKYLVSHLVRTNQLTQSTFDQTLKIVKEKLLPGEKYYDRLAVDSKKRKRENEDLSQIIFLDNSHLFFSQSIVAEGSFGAIKQGYADPAEPRPTYAIKEFKKNSGSALKQAKREVQCSRLLNRRAFRFNHETKTMVALDWLPGSKLSSDKSAEIIKVPLKSRFKAARTALDELNKLHQHHRVHGDISCTNVLWDPASESLHLIDFGSAHKNGSRKWFSHTPNFYDKLRTIQELQDVYDFSFCDDLYALSIVFTYLFPGFFTFQRIKIPPGELEPTIVHRDVKKEFYVIRDNTKPTATSCHEHAIQLLVHAMSHNQTGDTTAVNEARESQCTANDALQFCDRVLAGWDNLTYDSLKSIADAAIYHASLTAEDAFHGHLRQTKPFP